MRTLDHVLLKIRVKAVLRSEDCREPNALIGCQAVDCVPKSLIHRRRVTDDADTFAVELGGAQEAIYSELKRHPAIIP